MNVYCPEECKLLAYHLSIAESHRPYGYDMKFGPVDARRQVPPQAWISNGEIVFEFAQGKADQVMAIYPITTRIVRPFCAIAQSRGIMFQERMSIFKRHRGNMQCGMVQRHLGLGGEKSLTVATNG
jgi:hypothetical protein